MINYEYVERRLGYELLSAFVNSNGDIDKDLIDIYIGEVEAEIDNSLAQRYAYPYQFEASATGEKAANLIDQYKFLLVKHKIYESKYDNDIPQVVQQTAYAIRNRIEKIRKGEDSILGLVEKAGTAVLAIAADNPKKKFTRRNLKNHDN
jgi:hypothetical protein